VVVYYFIFMCVNIGGIWLSIYLATGKTDWLAFSDFLGRPRKEIWAALGIGSGGRQVGFGMGDDA
jgi:hypothetical protein